MKKLLFTFVLLLLGVATQVQVKITPKVGVALSTYRYANEGVVKKRKLHSGLIVGAGLEIPIVADRLSLVPELLFVQKGNKTSLIAVDDSFFGQLTFTYKDRLNYLELPALAKAHFGQGNVNGYVEGGPFASYSFGGKGSLSNAFFGSTKFDIEFDDNAVDESVEDGETLYYDNPLGIGLQLGAGIGAKVGPGTMGIGVRYSFGLTSLIDEDSSIEGDESIYSRALYLNLMYTIPL